MSQKSLPEGHPKREELQKKINRLLTETSIDSAITRNPPLLQPRKPTATDNTLECFDDRAQRVFEDTSRIRLHGTGVHDDDVDEATKVSTQVYSSEQIRALLDRSLSNYRGGRSLA